jgi:tetratricopeptide (TPR) repeat protein
VPLGEVGPAQQLGAPRDSFSEGLARVVSAHELGIVDRDVWRFLDGFVTRGGPDTLRFRNAIVRDVAYEGLTFRRRRSLHALVGETIERFAEDPTDEAEILSLHFLRADDAARAWRYSHVAAERAAAIYANVEAATFYERALDAARRLADLDAAERLRTLERLGDVRERAGLYDEAGRAYTDARKLCGDELCRSRLMLKQARIEDTTGSSSGALRAISRALSGLDGLDRDDARAVRAQLEVWYGAIRLSQGRPREAVRWCERAIEDARAVGEKDALAHALYVLDWAYFDLGRPELATHGDEVIQLYGELGDLSRQADAYNLLGNFAYWEGRWSEAIELYERGKERQQQAGDLVGAAMGTANVAEILTQQGELDRAEQLTREALRVFAASGYRLPSAFAYGILGDIASRRGRHREAARHYVRGLHLVQQGGDQHEEIAMLGKVAEDLLRQGEAPAALGLVELALARAEPLGGAGDQAPLLHRLRGWSLAQTGRLDEAVAAFEEGLRDARERGWDLEVALALRGRVSPREPAATSPTTRPRSRRARSSSASGSATSARRSRSADYRRLIGSPRPNSPSVTVILPVDSSRTDSCEVMHQNSVPSNPAFRGGRFGLPSWSVSFRHHFMSWKPSSSKYEICVGGTGISASSRTQVVVDLNVAIGCDERSLRKVTNCCPPSTLVSIA